MNENEAAELFNRNLDAALSGGRRVSSGFDPGAMETAARFVRADLSGESAIKDALRARLAGDARVMKASLDMPKPLRFRFYAQASLALVCLALIVAVLVRPDERRAAAPHAARPAVETGVPGGPARGVLTADARAAVVRPGVRALDEGRSSAGFFQAIPMARLSGERLENFPIETAGGSPIAVVQGREIELPDGTGVVWETGDAVFTLESREISPEDLFQRTAL